MTANDTYQISSERVCPPVTVLPYDIGIAKVFGSIRAHQRPGMILPDADIQIAATAIGHNLELVTGNIRHFDRISGLKLQPLYSQTHETDKPHFAHNITNNRCE